MQKSHFRSIKESSKGSEATVQFNKWSESRSSCGSIILLVVLDLFMMSMMVATSNRSGQLSVQFLVVFFYAALFKVEAIDPTGKELCANISNGVFLLERILVCEPLHYQKLLSLHVYVCIVTCKCTLLLPCFWADQPLSHTWSTWRTFQYWSHRTLWDHWWNGITQFSTIETFGKGWSKVKHASTDGDNDEEYSQAIMQMG